MVKQNKLSDSYVIVAVLLSQTARATERSKDNCTSHRWILIEVCLQKFCIKSFVKLVLPLLNIKEQNNITASDTKGAVIEFAWLRNYIITQLPNLFVPVLMLCIPFAYCAQYNKLNLPFITKGSKFYNCLIKLLWPYDKILLIGTHLCALAS